MDDQSFNLIRKAGPFEVLSNLFHDLGVQSNVLVTAEYSHATAKLTPELLYPALAEVINEHPALSIIGVTQPSEKKAGNHRLWEARLPSIDLSQCVEFVEEDGKIDLGRLVERYHNEWFDTKDKSKPWWKVIVLNGMRVTFLYHHSIADGLSGYAFHRSLLLALNQSKPSQQNHNVITTDRAPPPYPLDVIKTRLMWIKVIYDFLFWVLIRFFVNEKRFLFSDAVVSPAYPTVLAPFPTGERTITRAEILRIDNATMSECVAACRAHETSFTAMLHTLIQVTFATDIYKDARLGFSRLAVNIRPFLGSDFNNDVFTNAASAHYRVQRLGPYRIHGIKGVDTSTNQDLTPQISKVWELARKYKRHLDKSIFKSGSVIQSFLTGKLLGEDDEQAGTFYGLGLYQNNSFLISNLGVFESKIVVDDGQDEWRVTDIAFSAGAIRAKLGDFGMSFNVATVKGGDCVVTAVFEEGVLEKEMVRAVLDTVEARLRVVI